MSQQAKISYTVNVSDIPGEVANILLTLFNKTNLLETVEQVSDELFGVSTDNYDARAALVKLEKLRQDLAVLDQRVVEVSNILMGLQEALSPEPEPTLQQEAPVTEGE